MSEYKRQFTFGTWNVRGLTEKKRETFAEIERENKDVVVLTETKLRGSGKEEFGNYVHVYSGVRVGVARAGVSVLIKKEHSKYMRWKVINERIIRVRLKVFDQKVVILGVYWIDDCAKPDVKDRFEDAVTRVLKNLKINDEIVILGDFNAWVGISSNSKTVGKYGDDRMNNNGRRLIELCNTYRLKIQNTFFEHEDIHKYTFYDRTHETKTIIDYCITRQATALKIIDVVACRWLECGTDHVYLEAITIFSSFPISVPKHIRYHSYLLFCESINTQYKEHQDLNIILDKDRSAIEIYDHLKDVIHSAARDTLGIVFHDERSQFLWDEELRKLSSSWNLKCRRRESNAYLDQFINSFKTDTKNEVWLGICDTIDKVPKQLQKRKLISSILAEFKTQNFESITADKELIEIYIRNFFKESRNNFIDNEDKNIKKTSFSIFPADVIQALDEFVDSDIPSPGGISMRLLKHSSNKLKRLLKELIQAIFDGQKIPDEISETFFMYQVGDEKYLNHVESCKYVSHPIMQVMTTIIKNFIEKSNPFREKCKIIHEESRLNATFILRMLMQKCVDKQNKPLHLIFINLEETFFDVPLIKLYNELHKLGVEEDFIEIIKHLYSENSMRIIFPDETSKQSCIVTRGLKKNCLLSFTLFDIYVRRAMKEWLKENDKKGFPFETLKMFTFITQRTNLVILSENTKHLGAAVDSLIKHFEKMHLKISFKSIKYLGIVEDTERELKIGKKTIMSDDSLDFMGSVLETNGRNDADIFNRIITTKRAIGSLHSVARDNVITMECKKRIYNSIIESSLIFGCETWTMTKTFTERLLSVEVLFWKWCVESYPNRYSKNKIFQLVDVEDDVEETIKLKRSAWFANLKLMAEHKWPKCVLEWTADGKSKPGRRKRWIEGIEEFINDLSLREGFIAKNMHLQNIISQNRELQDASH